MAQYDQTIVAEAEDELQFRKGYGVVPMLCNYPDPTVPQGYVWDGPLDEGLRVNGLVGNWEGGARIVDDSDYLGRTKRAIKISDYNRYPYTVPELTGIYMKAQFTGGPDVSLVNAVWDGYCEFEILGEWPNSASTTSYHIFPYLEPPAHPAFYLSREMWIEQHWHRTTFHVYHERGYPASPWYVNHFVEFPRGEWGRIKIIRKLGGFVRMLVSNNYIGVGGGGDGRSLVLFDTWLFDYDYMPQPRTPSPGWAFWVQPFFDGDFGGDWLKIRNITLVNNDYHQKIGAPLPE